MFYDREISHTKFSVTFRDFIVHPCTIILHFCVLFISHPVDGRRNGLNVFLNMRIYNRPRL
jgi:hypothetical protein